MKLTYLPILKALPSEYEASKNLEADRAASIHPLFDVPVISSTRKIAKKYLESSSPISDYFDEVAQNIKDSWKGGVVLIDAFNWPPDAAVETGEHIVTYLFDELQAKGVSVAPVFGYDRWDDPVYRVAMRGIDVENVPYTCLRLEASAVEDSAEPEIFYERVEEILNELELDPENCVVLLDFGDLTAKSLMDLIDDANRVIGLLKKYGFMRIVTAGSSMPKSIDLAVKKPDSVGRIVRKEMLLWQTLSTEFPRLPLVYGDYGVRGPGSNDAIQNPHANAKIRYTCGKAFLVSRGHSIKKDKWAIQMPGVASEIVKSKEYLPGFSWGDKIVERASLGLSVKNGHGKWIAYDTNHHLAFVLEEVLEFQRSVARPIPAPLI